jgi:dihydroorotate dehydrogenase (fumarate)
MNQHNNISTTYLGLSLKSPVIASSSDFTNSVAKIIELEKAGAGAIVLKSIFEEQILMEIDALRTNNMFDTYGYNEEYIAYYTKLHETNQYIQLIKEAKEATSIPIIASINCFSDSEWVSFAKNIEQAGADAIELNIFILPSNPNQSAVEIRDKYFAIVRNVRKNTTLPIAVKLHHYFTDMAAFMVDLSKEVDSLVLFNRFFNPDINTDTFNVESAGVFSNPSDHYLVQRWIGLLSGKVQSELSASGGIHDASGVIKSMLAGANVVQIASVLYQNGVDEITKMNQGLSDWMTQKGFSSISEFKGKSSAAKIVHSGLYERAQFMKYFSDFEK